MDIEQFEELSLMLGLSGLIGYMLFIIYKMAKESNAGKFGMFVLFFVLGLGIFGFVAKHIIKIILGIE